MLLLCLLRTLPGSYPGLEKKCHLHKKDYVLSKKKRKKETTLWHKNMLHKPPRFKCFGHAHVHCHVRTQFPLRCLSGSAKTKISLMRYKLTEHVPPSMPASWHYPIDQAMCMTSELWHSLHLIRIPPLPVIFKYRHLQTNILCQPFCMPCSCCS